MIYKLTRRPIFGFILCAYESCRLYWWNTYACGASDGKKYPAMSAFRTMRRVVVPTVAILLVSCGQKERFVQQAPKTLLTVNPDPVSLGLISAGKSARATLTVTNSGGKRQQITNVRTTCPCVGLVGLPVSIEPGRSVGLTVIFDPTEEPDFRGTLGVGLIGMGATGDELFQTEVNLTVNSDTVPLR